VVRALLLSGGLDSIALAYWCQPEICITIDYGQVPAAAELRAAKAFCAATNLPHEVIRVDCRSLGSGDLAQSAASSFAPSSEWWPFRNQLLVTLAAMRAIAIRADELLIGCVAGDSFHVDSTAEFVAGLDNLLAAQEGHIRLAAPA
jgi:7-cyano-7-deazaguanine synthase